MTFPVQSLSQKSVSTLSPSHAACAQSSQSVIKSSVRDINQVLNDRLALGELERVHELGRAKLLRPRLLPVVRVDGDDARRLARDGALDDGESDGAEAEDGDGLTLLDVRGLGPGE